MAEHQPQQHPQHQPRDHDDELVRSGGGLRYQQAHREPGDVEGGAPRSSATTAAPSLRQRGKEYGGPTPDEQALLHRHGYPKLGQKLPSRVTQVEHGPYAGGSQQGDTKPAATKPAKRGLGVRSFR